MRTGARRAEWATNWPAPLAAMTGIACSASFAYASGVLMVPMTAELHWSRAEFSSGFTLMMVSGLLFLPLAGRLADRIGARRLILAGVLPYTLWFALLGFAGQSVALWWLLCVGISVFTAAVTPPVWMSPVVATFVQSRGLAIAVALSGIGLGMAVWPTFAAIGIRAIGWRHTIFGLAFLAGATMAIATIGLSRSRRQSGVGEAAGRPAATPLGQVVRSRTFLCIAVAGGLFSSVSFGLSLHFVPVLQASGMTLTAASGVAGLIGIFSIIGRLGTGFLLDRVPTRAFGVAVFLLPILTALLLMHGGAWAGMVGAAVLGLAGGAELDIVAYLAATRFPRDGFASIYATATSIFAVCASTGPLLAGALFDARGSYDLYLMFIAPIVIVAAIMIWFLPAAPIIIPEKSHDA